MKQCDVLIVGGGLAGASTAFHLSLSFRGSILLVEREPEVGLHASGRNAGLLLQPGTAPELRRLVCESRRFLDAHREDTGFRSVGSTLIGPREALETHRDDSLFESHFVSPRTAVEQVPLLEKHDFETALWTPSDGTVNTRKLLEYFLEGARSRGVEIVTDCGVLACEKKDRYQVLTSQGRIETSRLLNAAGAWASRIGKLAGASAIPLFPRRRHLFVLTELFRINPDWPFVWSLDPEFYFRPEGEDLLFSLCDEEESDLLEDIAGTEIIERLSELLFRELPRISPASLKRAWSCFRTWTLDGLPLIGWDPDDSDFFWVAGLGGHGMASSWEIGRTATRRFLDEDDGTFSPARFKTLETTDSH